MILGWTDICLRNDVTMLRIQRTTGKTTVLTVIGRLGAENVSELCQLVETEPTDKVLVLDLADLVLADRAVVRILRNFELQERIVLRNCPAYIREWITREQISE